MTNPSTPSPEPALDPTPEALHAVFRVAGWSYTPPRDIFSHAEWNVWTAAARALDAFTQAAVEKERAKFREIINNSAAYDNFECGYGFHLGKCPTSNHCVECEVFKITHGGNP